MSSLIHCCPRALHVYENINTSKNTNTTTDDSHKQNSVRQQCVLWFTANLQPWALHVWEHKHKHKHNHLHKQTSGDKKKVYTLCVYFRLQFVAASWVGSIIRWFGGGSLRDWINLPPGPRLLLQCTVPFFQILRYLNLLSCSGLGKVAYFTFKSTSFDISWHMGPSLDLWYLC